MKLAYRPVLTLAVAMIGVLVMAPAAMAIIQVQRGISGVVLGMTPAQVKAGLGAPPKVKKGTNDFGKFTQFFYAGGSLTVTFQGNTNVTAVAITGQTDRTPAGVGVGSTEAAVKSGVKGVACHTTSGTRSCDVGKLLPGHRVTDFLLKAGKVARVTVGFVID
jgi:hypothetical protein